MPQLAGGLNIFYVFYVSFKIFTRVFTVVQCIYVISISYYFWYKLLLWVPIPILCSVVILLSRQFSESASVIFLQNHLCYKVFKIKLVFIATIGKLAQQIGRVGGQRNFYNVTSTPSYRRALFSVNKFATHIHILRTFQSLSKYLILQDVLSALQEYKCATDTFMPHSACTLITLLITSLSFSFFVQELHLYTIILCYQF